MIQKQNSLPAWQQAIIDKCYHPIGVWEAFPEHALESSIPACFEAIVARYPERIAVVDQQRALTYAELNAAANQVAHGLVAHLGPGPEPICHLCDFSIAGLVALLGVLKAGKFYVPLDNRWPVATLRQILALVETRLIVCDSPNQELTQQVAEGQAEAATLDDLALEVYQNLDVVVSPKDRQYIVFTSGSTGVPKGVVDIHRNSLYIAAQFIDTYHICPQDRNLHASRFSFSGSLNTMYGTFFAGASLYLYDVHTYGIENLAQWMFEHKLTTMTCTPPVFRWMAEAVERSGRKPADIRTAFESMRLVGTGGDRTLPADLAAFRRLMPDTALFKVGYATSEVKLPITLLVDKQRAPLTNPVPIGWPPRHLTVLIMDRAGAPLPAGETGEIVLHSRIVARGYWKQPQLTRQKFRPDPERPGWFYYYTGDLGRIDGEGCVYHLGRIDSQVKVRGQRVELAEIEQLLLAIENVRDAIVLLRGDAAMDQRLVAWLVWEDPAQPVPVSQLRRTLAQKLSAYMVPAYFITLEQLPLNSNGKVDRQRLPAPDGARPILDVDFVPPQTPLEVELARIWAEVLGIDQVGVHDNFFDLGGNSIQAMQILSRLQGPSRYPIYFQALFGAPTIAQMMVFLMAHYIEQHETMDAYPLVPDQTVEIANNGHQYQGITSAQIARFRKMSERQFVGEQIVDTQTPQKAKPALFILSAPRAGSTLLRVMLAGHPRIFAPPELYLLNYIDLQQRRQVNQERSALRLEGTIRALMALHDCSVETALEMMATYEAQILPTPAFYAILQADAGERFLVDKTPAYAANAAVLHRAETWFQAARYIHLSRHPLGMIHSFVSSRYHLHYDPAAEFAPQQLAELIWLTYHENIEAFLRHVPVERHLHVRYEDLVAEPEATMHRICALLKIPFQQELLEPYAAPPSRMTDGLYAESLMIGDPNFHQFTRIQADRADAWRHTLTGELLSPASKAMARRLGYTDV